MHIGFAKAPGTISKHNNWFVYILSHFEHQNTHFGRKISISCFRHVKYFDVCNLVNKTYWSVGLTFIHLMIIIIHSPDTYTSVTTLSSCIYTLLEGTVLIIAPRNNFCVIFRWCITWYVLAIFHHDYYWFWPIPAGNMHFPGVIHPQ